MKTDIEIAQAVVNDVSGRFNPDIASLVENYNAGWIVMHTGGGDADRMTCLLYTSK